MPVDLRNLRFIVAAAQHGSFRRAAASLGVKQSTMSRSIRAVEDRLDVRLFDRHNGGARLTPVGETFAQSAALVVTTVADMVLDAKTVARGEQGRLAVGGYNLQVARRLHRLVGALRQERPQARIVLSEGSRERLLTQVDKGALDVAFLVEGPGLSSFESTPAWASRLVAVLPAGHPLITRSVLSWTDLAGASLLASRGDPGPAIEAVLQARLGGMVPPPDITWHDVGHAALPSLAASGLGLALVCAQMIDAARSLAIREVEGDPEARSLAYVAVTRRGNRNPLLRQFLALTRRLAAEPPRQG